MANNSLNASIILDGCSVYPDRLDSVDPTRTVLAVVNGIASPPTVVINALITWAVLGDQDLRSSCFNLLLVALAVTDFLVGVLVQPLYASYLRCTLVNADCYNVCFKMFSIYFGTALSCCGLTAFTLALLTLERYLAIELPNFYLKYVTAKRTVTTTIVYWTVSLTLLVSTSFLALFNNPRLYTVPAMVFAGINALIILYCSIKVQITAYRQRRTIIQQQELVQQPDEQQQQQQRDQQQQGQLQGITEEQKQEQRRQEFKRVFMMNILLVISVLFYTPIIIVTVIQAIGGYDVTSDFTFIGMPIATTFVHVQSLINPMLVSLRLSYIRTSIKSKIGALL